MKKAWNSSRNSFEQQLQEKEQEISEIKAENLKKIEENSKKFDEIIGENKRFSRETKLLKSQITALESKSSISQQLADVLKKDNKVLNGEKEKLLKELKENEEKTQQIVFFSFIFLEFI